MQTTFTRDGCEAALCLWEAMLAAKDKSEPWQRAMRSEWEASGTSAMRSWAIDKAAECDAAWLALSEDERDGQCFDWEFVPCWLAEQFSEAKDT